MLAYTAKQTNYFLTDEEIKLFNLVKIIVAGGWIIDSTIYDEVLLIAGIRDIIEKHQSEKNLDLELNQTDINTINTAKLLKSELGLKPDIK